MTTTATHPHPTTAPAHDERRQVGRPRIPLWAALASGVVISVALGFALRALGRELADVPAALTPLQPAALLTATILPVLGCGLGFYMSFHATPRPYSMRLFVGVGALMGLAGVAISATKLPASAGGGSIITTIAVALAPTLLIIPRAADARAALQGTAITMAVAGISPCDRAFHVRDEQDSRRVWSADALSTRLRERRGGIRTLVRGKPPQTVFEARADFGESSEFASEVLPPGARQSARQSAAGERPSQLLCPRLARPSAVARGRLRSCSLTQCSTLDPAAARCQSRPEQARRARAARRLLSGGKQEPGEHQSTMPQLLRGRAAVASVATCTRCQRWPDRRAARPLSS